MNTKHLAVSALVALALSTRPGLAAGEAASNPSLVGILYKQFDALKALFVEHQARVQGKLDQYEKTLNAPSTNALDRMTTSVHSGDWGAYAGSGLDKAFDGDSESATGWSQTASQGNTGWYLIDMGRPHRAIVKLKIGVAAANDQYLVAYSVQTSDDGVNFATVWQTDLWRIPAERIIEPTFATGSRWIRFRAHDHGRGAAMARIYDIEVTDVR